MSRIAFAWLLSFLMIFQTLSARAQADSASGESADLASEETLTGFLPEFVDEYELDQVSVPPFFSGKEDHGGITVNGLYTSEGGSSFFIGLSEYRDPEHRSVPSGDVSETDYESYPTYERSEPPHLSVHLGDAFEIAVYPAGGGDLSLGDLYSALEVVNVRRLVDVAQSPAAARASSEDDTSESGERGDTRTEVARVSSDGGANDEVDCSSFNEAFRAEVIRQFSISGRLAPWVHFLKPEQTETAEVAENELSFPQNGNPWLQCIQTNDVLWAPHGVDSFLRRVLEIEVNGDRIVFETETAGFNDAILEGGAEIEADDSGQ